jgi:LytR cell envelope-related transcriptional attenuator
MSALHGYQRRSWGSRIGIVFACLVALAAAGYVGSVVGPHFKAAATSSTTTTSTGPHSTTTSTLAHASVKVLVANGTQQANTAAHFAQQLQQQGWTVAAPTNTTSPAATTTVYYGVFWQQSARQIASEIGAPATAVQPLTAAVPVPNATGYYVVVVIGSDLAGTGFPATTAPGGSAPTTTVPAGSAPTT